MLPMRGILSAAVLLASFVLSGWAAEPGPAAPPAASEACRATEIVARYGSMPKGLILEDAGAGLPELKKVEYDKKKNRFVVNDTLYYANPVSREEGQELLKALAEDDRIGVSFTKSIRIAYGAVVHDGPLCHDLVMADLLCSSVIFAWYDQLENVKLPGNYKPLDVKRIRIVTVVCNRLAGYRFETVKDEIRRSGFALDITLMPVLHEKSKDGGHIPDWDAFRKGQIDAEDRANADHILTHQKEYFEIPVLEKAARFGELAAFGRAVREAKLDLNKLAKQLR